MKKTQSAFFALFLIFASSLLLGCSSEPVTFDKSNGFNPLQSSLNQKINTVSLQTMPVAMAINKAGCGYNTVQKVLFGLPLSASDRQLKMVRGTLDAQALNKIHGLPANASIEDLYLKVYSELFSLDICSNMT